MSVTAEIDDVISCGESLNGGGDAGDDELEEVPVEEGGGGSGGVVAEYNGSRGVAVVTAIVGAESTAMNAASSKRDRTRMERSMAEDGMVVR